VFVAALIHAWALWNYLLGGLVLYYVDRLLRFQKGCTDVVVMSSTITKDQQHVRLALRIPDYYYEPGQYAFFFKCAPNFSSTMASILHHNLAVG